ncbi:hypothetical protein EDB81DRAFT_323152 [Dactylonectria macrodidyma]|uniref:Uncharacterized protein n=1 Tax=Dactylonectria macrodidyma TaxID=307937 RepID=A0A9P9FEX3_9HYPO|nr:hypothetical protein EDB81DRAFT_323152 [Dactylonectria macrodidyma]
MSQHRPASNPRRRSSRRRSSERGGTGADVVPPRPYLVEWSAQTRRQRGIPDVDVLREEMGAPERPGWRRLLVMRGREDDVDVLVGLGLGEGRGRRAGWAWEYPEVEAGKEAGRMAVGEGGCVGRQPARQGIRLCRAALSTKTRIPILLLDGLPPNIPQGAPRPSHQARQRRRSSGPPVEPPSRSGLEDALWGSLGADDQPLEDLLAGLAYDAWLDALPPPHEGDTVEMLWTLAQALETNADAARAMERRGVGAGVGAGGVTAADWTALAERLHRRMHLSVAISLQHKNSQAPPPNNANARSLDRIAYLGGLLFPATVVSGILSIEGTYGPEGSAFWVFWLAAGLSSVFALLVIYADNLRTLDVWIEVAAGEVDDVLLHHHRPRRSWRQQGDEERGEAGVTTTTTTTTTDAAGVYVVQRRGDGTEGRAWRRKELGWLGAVKKMSGWYMVRGSPGMEFRRPGRDEGRAG